MKSRPAWWTAASVCGISRWSKAEQPRLWFARAAKLLTPHPASRLVCIRLPSLAQMLKFGEDVTVGPVRSYRRPRIIGAGTRIEAGAVIGQGVHIGERCRIYPRAVLYPGTTLGNRVVVHAGAVLGADGFGYVRDPATGAYTQFPQQGTLVIEDDVEIGANTTIDRGALDETRIRPRHQDRQPGARGPQLRYRRRRDPGCADRHLRLVARWASGAVIAGQVGIGDHAHVGPGVILGGQAGVFSGKTVTNEGAEAGNGSVGHAGASAQAGAARAGGGGAAGEAKGQGRGQGAGNSGGGKSRSRAFRHVRLTVVAIFAGRGSFYFFRIKFSGCPGAHVPSALQWTLGDS